MFYCWEEEIVSYLFMNHEIGSAITKNKCSKKLKPDEHGNFLSKRKSGINLMTSR